MGEVNIKIRNPGLGLVPPNAGNIQVKVGVCSKGTPNTVYSFGSVKAAQDALGSGPLLEAVCQALSVAGGPVMAVPLIVAAGSFGAAPGAMALTGSGTGTITVTRGAEQSVRVKIILGGTLTTATFKVKVGSGGYGATITTGAGPFNYQVPGEYFTNLQFAAGTYVADDEYVLNTDGTVTRIGSGSATLLNGSTHSPVDNFDVWVQITTAGALATAAFKYSLDGGNNFSAPILTPVGGVYAIGGSGLVLTFSGTFVLDDVYKVTASPAGYVSGDVNTALTALLADPAAFGWVHLVGMAADAAGAATMAGVVDTKLAAAEAVFRYVWGAVECPAEGDSAVKTAFLNFISERTAVCVGDVGLRSPLTGRTTRRNHAWSMTARLGGLNLSLDPAQVDLGGLQNVSSIYRDEGTTPGLDDARLCTVRTYAGLPGYYLTNFRMMGMNGSDFTYGVNRRVMDRICTLTRQGYLLLLMKRARIDEETGYIDERDAQAYDAQVTGKLRADLMADPQEVTTVKAQLSRTDNLLSTGTLNAEVEAIPFGYFRTINATVGFVNPALQQARAA
jgi:hypothetical protein